MIGRYTKLFIIITLLAFFSNCGKDCKKHTYNYNVDESYLPDIIPYSDTSTRLFLKNGKDTLVFKSLGLKRQIVQEEANVEVCDIYKMEHLSLRMAASDTDFFDIFYYVDRDGTGFVKIGTKNHWSTQEILYIDFSYFYPPINKLNILGNIYDSVLVFSPNIMESVFVKPKLGYLKIKTGKVTYELIN